MLALLRRTLVYLLEGLFGKPNPVVLEPRYNLRERKPVNYKEIDDD
jgi:hypothetical protein